MRRSNVLEYRFAQMSAFARLADVQSQSKHVRKVPHPESCTAAKNKLPPIGVFGWTRFWLKGIARVTSISKRGNQNGGGFGRGGFGPKARAVSRCWRLTLERASCRAYSMSPSS